MMKWLAAICLALVFAVLSFNAFIHNNLSQQKSSNRIIAMLTDLYSWLLSSFGGIPTGVLFAICAIGVVVAAALDGRKREVS